MPPSMPAPDGRPSYDSRTNSFQFSRDDPLGFFATLCLKVTGACGAKCAFCCEPDRALPVAPASQWKPLIQEAAALGTRRFSLSGGEPLLYPDLLGLLDLVKQAGAASFLATASPKRMASLAGRLEGRLDAVRFSLLGLGDAHDRQIGRPGSFARIEDAIRACRQNRIEVFASTVATREILPQIPGIARWVASRQIPKLYVFSLLDSGKGWSFRNRIGDIDAADLHAHVGEAAAAVSNRGVAVTLIPNDLYGENVLCYGDGRVEADPVPDTPRGQAYIGNWRDHGIRAIWNTFLQNEMFLESLSKRARIY